MKKAELGEFSRIFGATPKNIILEFFVDVRDLDFGIGDVARECGLNRATTYNTMEELVRESWIVPTRKVGKTQLYKFNVEKPESKAFIEINNLLMDKIVQRYHKKEKILA